MSRTTIKTLVIMSTLALGAFGVAACGDDDKEDTKADAGGDGDGDKADAGGDGDKGDAGGDKADSGSGLPAGSIKCGELTCAELPLPPGPTLGACCTKDADDKDACGLASTNLAAAGDVECVLRDAPGKKSDSCGALWDMIDGTSEAMIPVADGGTPVTEDGFFTSVRPLSSATVISQFNGCCTPAGKCSIQFKDPNITLSAATGSQVLGPRDLGYGCADPALVGVNLGAEMMGFGTDGIGCDYANGGAVNETPQSLGDAGTDGGN
jgi:hypothetical protein